MINNHSIKVEKIVKDYRLYRRHIDRVKEILHPLRKKYHRPFRALNGVSFEVKKGEAFGIIGRNGGGKSTLLQIISGIIEPTEGKVTVQGRVAALLELGAGFNPEFTGRENIYINAAILGLSKAEIEARLDSIVAFADIGQFIDQKVKFYSSGMFMRLAFAVSTSVDADILLIDEALAVGDFFFRQKCYRRLEELRERGISILLVTHAMTEVQQFCQRAVLLNHGDVVICGSAAEAVKHYYLIHQSPVMKSNCSELKVESKNFKEIPESDGYWPNKSEFIDLGNVSQVSNGDAECTALAICNHAGIATTNFQQGETVFFYYEFLMKKNIEIPVGGVVIQNDKGIIVHGKNTLQYDSPVPKRIEKGTAVRFRQKIELRIAIGEYALEFGMATIGKNVFEKRGMLTNDDIAAKIERLCYLPAFLQFVVLPRENYQPVQLLHHGIADLPGQCDVFLNS